jgi:YidC/Oxa1 family membrane protein insertase
LQRAIGQSWGYGVAIIIITVIIKMLFWPLTHKSTVSMRKMQKIQPLVQEIRTKYKDDAQTMNRKVMELYREHKVNPLGGCLPILFQIPVFFALFNTLRGAIELRHASFLWVADLSMPDTLGWMPLGLPIRPLAILMGVTMLLQQRLSPSTSDPSQTRMMMFMTLFFMFIFYSMPAGLTLYWTVNQILTLSQNLLIRKLEQKQK